MKTHDCYRLYVTPLSPVHIGTGESYEPTNYVIDDDVLHEFDSGAVMAMLASTDRDALLAIANRKPDAEMIKALQRFFHERRDALKACAMNRIPVLPGVADLYASRIGRTAQREGGGQVLNRLEIDRTAYDPITRRPVLFGSSLKGAIRTALLDLENAGRKAQEKKGLHEFQGRLLHYFDPHGHPRLALERDPLRLVQLTDCRWKVDAALPSAQVHLAVNRKKAPVLDKNTGQMRKAMGENLYQILESVTAWHARAFTGQINIQELGGLENPNELPTSYQRYTMQAIAHACNEFYRPILNGERKLLRERAYLGAQWDQTIDQALAVADRKLKRGDAFLLRVGRHSGAESVTVSGARTGNIRIMEGKDPQTGKRHFSFADSPKTLWLAAETKDQRKGLLPFGWLLVEIQPLDAPDQDWPELRELCEPRLQQARSFAARLEQQADRHARARAEAEQRRLQEIEQARKQADEEARETKEAAERQARLAAMSENARQVEALRARMGPANKGRRQGDQLYQQTNQLIKAAAGWSTEDRQLLRAAAVAIFEHLGLKKDDYKKLIRDLPL